MLHTDALTWFTTLHLLTLCSLAERSQPALQCGRSGRPRTYDPALIALLHVRWRLSYEHMAA